MLSFFTIPYFHPSIPLILWLIWLSILHGLGGMWHSVLLDKDQNLPLIRQRMGAPDLQSSLLGWPGELLSENLQTDITQGSWEGAVVAGREVPLTALALGLCSGGWWGSEPTQGQGGSSIRKRLLASAGAEQLLVWHSCKISQKLLSQGDWNGLCVELTVSPPTVDAPPVLDLGREIPHFMALSKATETSL